MPIVTPIRKVLSLSSNGRLSAARARLATQRRRVLVDVVEEEREFVTAEPGGGVAGRIVCCQAVGDQAEEVVGLHVAEASR